MTTENESVNFADADVTVANEDRTAVSRVNKVFEHQPEVGKTAIDKMSPKDFKLRYEAVNKEGTFSEGDTITGIVSFTLTKDTKVECLTVKAKGDAHVHWSKGTGDDRRSYSAWRKLFKEKENVIAKKDSGG